MRVGSFSVFVPEGRERDSGHVEINHGQVYTLRIGNHFSRRCDAEVTVDGKSVGGFRLSCGEVINLERPAHDTGRFTFFQADSPEAVASGAAGISVDQRGLIQVTFKPEKERQYVTRGSFCSAQSMRGQSIGGATRDWDTFSDEVTKTSGPIGFAGVTGLTGQSNQQFVTVANLEYDPTLQVTISLRLVVGQGAGPRPLTPVNRGNEIPAPV